MKNLALTTCAFVISASAHAECVVADPTTTPLNAHSAPNGPIAATASNGLQVTILDYKIDEKRHVWAYIKEAETGYPIGWVWRQFIVCKGERELYRRLESLGVRPIR